MVKKKLPSLKFTSWHQYSASYHCLFCSLSRRINTFPHYQTVLFPCINFWSETDSESLHSVPKLPSGAGFSSNQKYPPGFAFVIVAQSPKSYSLFLFLDLGIDDLLAVWDAKRNATEAASHFLVKCELLALAWPQCTCLKSRPLYSIPFDWHGSAFTFFE